MKDSFDRFDLDRMRNDPNNYIWGIFYFNPRDDRTILPKRNKLLGWTLNFAKTETYLFLILIFALGWLVSKI